jgi:hypothetical protein
MEIFFENIREKIARRIWQIGLKETTERIERNSSRK